MDTNQIEEKEDSFWSKNKEKFSKRKDGVIQAAINYLFVTLIFGGIITYVYQNFYVNPEGPVKVEIDVEDKNGNPLSGVNFYYSLDNDDPTKKIKLDEREAGRYYGVIGLRKEVKNIIIHTEKAKFGDLQKNTPILRNPDRVRTSFRMKLDANLRSFRESKKIDSQLF